MQRQNERFVERLPLADVHASVALGATIMLCAFAVLARMVAEPWLHVGYPYVTLFPAVILASFLFGTRFGVMAAILCGIAAWYLFIPPLYSFSLSLATLVALGFYLVVVGTDIALVHWMQLANRKLAEERHRNAMLAENRELLFRELQHRVSNNLQVVAALLALQRRAIGHDGARKALDEASSRLSLIGKISRALYDPAGQRLGIKSFIETLVADIIEANGRNDLTLELAISEDAVIDPDAAIPFSLIVAEVISNAIEHGFGGRQGGILLVRLYPSADARQLVLDIEDDGHGLPADFDPNGASLGLRIANTLAQQLNGFFALAQKDTGGVRATLILPC